MTLHSKTGEISGKTSWRGSAGGPSPKLALIYTSVRSGHRGCRRTGPQTVPGRFQGIPTTKFLYVWVHTKGVMEQHASQKGFRRLFIRSGKLQNESFPNFSIFRPEFCPEFWSEFSPNFSRIFRASFHGRRRPEKIHQKSRHFSMQNSQANTQKIFTKFFWRAGKVVI